MELPSHATHSPAYRAPAYYGSAQPLTSAYPRNQMLQLSATPTEVTL